MAVDVVFGLVRVVGQESLELGLERFLPWLLSVVPPKEGAGRARGRSGILPVFPPRSSLGGREGWMNPPLFVVPAGGCRRDVVPARGARCRVVIAGDGRRGIGSAGGVDAAGCVRRGADGAGAGRTVPCTIRNFSARRWGDIAARKIRQSCRVSYTRPSNRRSPGALTLPTLLPRHRG